ncbi:MAG: hypothetical protein AAF808_13660 [Cyanobacteria bacterium P01_D01_bin.2]
MFQNPAPGAAAPTKPLAPLPEYASGRHLLFGTLAYVQTTIRLLHKLNYAEPKLNPTTGAVHCPPASPMR